MDNTNTISRQVWFGRAAGRNTPSPDDGSEARGSRSDARVPRVAKLMALALRYEQLLESGHVRNHVELAQLADVTNARLTQIMGLRLLAPDIQEAILHLPPTSAATDPISDRALRPIVAQPNWARQRRMWADLLRART